MKYRWLKSTLPNKRDIEQLLGMPVKKIRTGNISNDEAITIQGIEIEVDGDLTQVKLAELDKALPELMREYITPT